jgi:hypothetical protein
MTDTEYNGWTNRETWACNLWITNDQGLYESAKEVVNEEITLMSDEDSAGMFAHTGETVEHYKGREAGKALQAWWEELTDPEEGLMEATTILQMVRDIGDEDKINWSEIAEVLLSE